LLVVGVIPSAAAFQAEREPALSEAEGDLARLNRHNGESALCGFAVPMP